ncbi:hypothetical protein ANN_12270, partial [Periplaneta americana]
YMLPDRFLDIYNNLSEEVKESIRAGKLETLTPDTFAKLHISLFLLIPASTNIIDESSRLKNVSGSSFASLLSSYPQDVSVAVKIMGTLKSESIRDFFEKLQGVNLSPDNQYEIAKALVKPTPDVNTNWTYTRFRMIEGIGSPLLAYIPPYYLANLTKLEASKFEKIISVPSSKLAVVEPPADMWSEKLEASKRAWTDLMFRSSYPFSISEWKENEGRRFRYFLEGATPDELKWLTAQQLQSTKLFKTHLSRLQVQTLFNILYSNGNLSSANLTEKELLPVALQLSPANLQNFNINTTDFRVLTSLFVKQEKLCSYATAKQILQSLIAQSVLSGRLESERPETWGDGIEHLGKFIYILPAKALEPYKLSPPSALVQSIIDSDKVTARQARMVTGGKILDLENPDFMLSQKGLLRALPSSQLVAATTLPQFLLSHLLANLPSDLPVKVAALLQKVKKLTGDPFTLKTILTNKERNQFFKIMPSRTIATIITDLQNIKDFDNDIKQLPQNTLSVWLAAMRTKLTNKNGLWTSDILLSNRSYPALLGLSCNDIYAMETVDFIYIMEQYNRARKNVSKPFPKDLQYCSQMALMNYLEMKASLQVANHSPELLDYLQPAEIAAVGGYILSTLPAQDIEVSSHSQQILEAIGQLPFPELLVATKESKPQMYAKLLLKTHTVCADSATRAAWYQILLKTFGDTFTWTAGTLAILGDFLAVVPTDGLNSVPEDSWREAADTSVEQSSYHVKVDWPGKVDTIPIYQACAEVLDDSESADYIAAVRGLTRWYLAALQNQLNAVVSASQLIAQSKKVESKGKWLFPTFPVEIEHPESIVKVLEPDEDEEPIRMKRPGAEMDFTTEELVVSGNTKMEQSRDILRAVLVSDTSHSTSQTSTPIESTTEVVSLQSKERTEMRYWQKLSCDAIRAAGPLAALALDETDVGHMGPVEVEKCADFFGTLDLDSKVQKKIWSLVNKVSDLLKLPLSLYKTDLLLHDITLHRYYTFITWPAEVVCNLKMGHSSAIAVCGTRTTQEEVLEHLSDLGKLVKVLDVDDISRIDLNLRTPYALDNLAIMSEMIVDTHVLHEVGSHFVQSNYGIKKMTTETAVALGRILCEVVTVTSQRLHDLLGQSVFLEASPVLGRMKDCPTPCLYKFAMLAMRSSEYGPLETWTAEDVATLGVVLAGKFIFLFKFVKKSFAS